MSIPRSLIAAVPSAVIGAKVEAAGGCHNRALDDSDADRPYSHPPLILDIVTIFSLVDQLD